MKAYNSNNRAENAFLKNIQTLKELLSEDNYTNVKNLSQSNYNNNQIFSYLKGIIRRLIHQNDRLSQRIKDLERQLTKIDPERVEQYQYRIEPEDNVSNASQLGQAAIKLHNFVPLKSRMADSFNKKFTQPTVFQQRPNPLITESSLIINRQNSKIQLKQIQKFISTQLSKCLVVDIQRKSAIPKDIIMALYDKWNIFNKREPVFTHRKQLKGLITNQLKKNFTNLEHNDKYYRGIAFRKDLVQASKSNIQERSKKSINSKKLNKDKGQQYCRSSVREIDDNQEISLLPYKNQGVRIDKCNKQLQTKQILTTIDLNQQQSIIDLQQQNNLLSDLDFMELFNMPNTSDYQI